MSVRTVKRFIGIFVLAFLVIFLILVVKLPGTKDITVDDDELTVPPQEEIHVVEESEPEPVVTPVVEAEPEPEKPAVEALEFFDEELPDNLKKIAEDYNVVGVSIIVVQNGEVAHSYAYGDSQRGGEGEEDVPFTSSSVMRVAGVSELVSAIGVMSLCEQNLLDLDEPIGSFLGYDVINPRVESAVTLRQIMTHTAGISDYGEYNDVVYETIKHQTLKSMLTGSDAKSNFYSYKPGYSYDFSNFGSAILGCIVSSVTQNSFDTFMKETVFAPLAVDAAYLTTSINDRTNIAPIYRQNTVNYTLDEMDSFAERLSDVADIDNYRISHGNLYISAAGLSRIMRLFLNYGSVDGASLLSEDSVKMMMSTAAEGSLYKDVGFGLCVNVKDDLVSGRTLYGHGGAAYGGTAEVFFDFTDKSGVVLICNGSLNTTDDSGFSLMGKAFIKEIYSTVIG